MSAEAIRYWIDTGHNVVVAAAAIIGGAWAYQSFRRERKNQAALSVDSSVTTEPVGGRHLAAFRVTLTNAGRIKIKARRHSSKYSDGVEALAHDCCLQLRRLEGPSATPRTVDWFDSAVARPVAGIEDINLLSDYENPEKGNAIEFWMEPGESYGLSAYCVLDSGQYLAKATFIADGDKGNFWTRLMQFSVPVQTGTGSDNR